MEEKFRGQMARLGAPAGVDAALQEGLDAQMALKAAKEELEQRDELLGAFVVCVRLCVSSASHLMSGVSTAQLAPGTPSTRCRPTWRPPTRPHRRRWRTLPRRRPNALTQRQLQL